MKRKTTGVLVLAVLVVAIFLGACASPLAEQAKTAKEKVQRETVAEKELLYDNGKNFLVVNSIDWAVITSVLQEWHDQHLDKQFVFGGLTHGAGALASDSPTVWIVYYENRKF